MMPRMIIRKNNNFGGKTAAALIISAAMLGGCTADTGNILGLDKKIPDEFAVVKRAPLTLPPDYGLRPPDPQGKRNQDLATRDEAQIAVFGRDAAKRRIALEDQLVARGATPGDIALLTRTGSFDSLPNIRAIVEEESASLAAEADSFVDDLEFWKEPEPLGDVVDSSSEARRLQENSALGNEVTEGETPVIRREADSSGFDFDFDIWPFD